MPLYNPTYIKSGLAKISGGALEWGIPTNERFIAASTTALTANEVRYTLMRLEYPVTLNAWQVEVTTGPASNANIALCIYKADSNLQPTGAPLYDSGSVAVASGFTGIKSATGLTFTLSPGMYLVGTNCDVAMTVRSFQSGTPMIAAALGASPLIQRVSVAQTFGAFPTPGTAWTSISTVSAGMQNFAVWQWTE